MYEGCITGFKKKYNAQSMINQLYFIGFNLTHNFFVVHLKVGPSTLERGHKTGPCYSEENRISSFLQYLAEMQHIAKRQGQIMVLVPIKKQE